VSPSTALRTIHAHSFTLYREAPDADEYRCKVVIGVTRSERCASTRFDSAPDRRLSAFAGLVRRWCYRCRSSLWTAAELTWPRIEWAIGDACAVACGAHHA
jgi:hypothetical protein